MDIEKEYLESALEAAHSHIDLLPPHAQRSIRIAKSLFECGVTCDELATELGGHNWVISRRSSRIVAKYGEDVICITPARFEKAQRSAIEKRF